MWTFITSLILFAGQPFALLDQNIRVTKISADIIVLHPASVRDLAVIREVGGTMVAVRTEDGLVVFDSFTSLPAGMKARELIESHFSNVPIRYLINSHHHSDHVQGNRCFRDACIIGHRNVERHMMEEYERLKSEYGQYDEKNMPTPPSVQVSSNALLKFGGKTFDILFFGTAHTDNDLVVLDREDRLLIMGDLLCHRKCYVMGPQSDAENWIALLDHLVDRRDEFDHVIPGHGGAAEDVDALIEQRDYLKSVCDAVTSARQKGLNLDEAKEAIRLEQFKDYMMYDRIGLDIEAYWRQIERKRD